MTSRKKITIDPLAIRRKCGLNQSKFWSAIGVTQSGGSRYETGRHMPKPVRKLLYLRYVAKPDMAVGDAMAAAESIK